MKKATKSRITMFESNPSIFDVRKYTAGEKEKLLRYMKSFEPYAAAGKITDCVTGERLDEEDVGYTDGEFMWTSRDIYHVNLYNASVSDEFFKIATK